MIIFQNAILTIYDNNFKPNNNYKYEQYYIKRKLNYERTALNI